MLGISKDLAYRIWNEAGVKPHRFKRHMANNDTDFDTKAADTSAHYLRGQAALLGIAEQYSH
jgi:hypothetical protein